MSSDVERMFDEAERTGLRLAIKGRLVALIVVGTIMAISRGADRAPEFLLATLGFSLLGIAHYYIIGSRFDRWWVKYAFLTIDVAVLSAAVAFLPATPETDLPQSMIFRFDIFPFYFIILGVAAFSFSPGLVLWAGVIGSAGWIGAFAWIYTHMQTAYNWSDIPQDPTPEQFLDVFLSPYFAPPGSRAQEALIFLVVSILIAIVMRRARRTVRRQLETERDMTAVSQMFGQYVPAAVAETMIRNKGALDPTERQATVLFTDLAGFTKLTEAIGPRAMVDTLNAFFDDASEIIGRHNGVVTQFQGDGILATFNVPLESENHAQDAFNAANELVELVNNKMFGGKKLQIRVGLSTGALIAGSVGGGGRQSYTVYGDPVNLAARLESLNKEHGTNILMSQSTASLLKGADFRSIGEIEVRGVREPVGVFAGQASG